MTRSEAETMLQKANDPQNRGILFWDKDRDCYSFLARETSHSFGTLSAETVEWLSHRLRGLEAQLLPCQELAELIERQREPPRDREEGPSSDRGVTSPQERWQASTAHIRPPP